jgi:hypothetical protein
MKFSIFALLIILVSCANSPDREVKKRVESEFLSYIGKSRTWSPQVEVLDNKSEQPVDLQKIEGIPPGYDRQRYFVSYQYDQMCEDSYAVFANFTENNCDYWFARTGGICE